MLHTTKKSKSLREGNQLRTPYQQWNEARNAVAALARYSGKRQSVSVIPCEELTQKLKGWYLALPPENKEGYGIGCSFCIYPSLPGWVAVRSTNWRCEDEIHALVPTAEARKMFRDLVVAGMGVY